MKQINRRDFLKLAGLMTAGLGAQRLRFAPGRSEQVAEGQNIIIVVLDALSAHHMGLYGHARDTMPNLGKLVQRAVVYHNHYATANFTSPGTASLLTGTLPWTHRALQYGGKVKQAVKTRNLFHAFPNYYRMAYSHNGWVNRLFDQFMPAIDRFTPRGQLFLAYDNLIDWLFKRDDDTAGVAWSRAINQREFGSAYGLFFPELYKTIKSTQIKRLSQDFPRGLPNVMPDNYYLLEHAIDFVSETLFQVPQPFLGYYHFLPPHDPYNTRVEFFRQFNDDGYRLPKKPDHFFSKIKSYQELSELATWYDEYILYADAEFARFYHKLEQAGLLENTWLILTSDHGEMFERGVAGHQTRLLHQSIVRIPLLIFEPGLEQRVDVFENTSAIDILPTILDLTAQEIPNWIEGTVLPPYNQSYPSERDIFALQARRNKAGKPITEGTAMLVRDALKLIYFWGYEELGQGGELVELYDLKADPGEKTNLYPGQKQIADELIETVMSKVEQSQA